MHAAGKWPAANCDAPLGRVESLMIRYHALIHSKYGSTFRSGIEMAQPNIAREPSMEEILASIRRIIESNDPISESHAVSGTQASSYLEEDEEFDVESDYDDGYMPQVPANDRGVSYPEHVQAEHTRAVMEMREVAAEPPHIAEKSLSLADVAARVRAAAVRPSESPTSSERTVPNSIHQEALRPGSSSEAQGYESEARSRSAQEREYEAPASHRSRDYHDAPAHAAEPQREQTLPVRIEQATSLLSEAAGAQIARSFNDLAEVVNGIERESVEDMAKEMLKPMLREWLDDNLPTLVERLVREEIERVARGPRR